MGGPRPHSLERLLWKYRMLAALRARREAIESEGATCFDPAEGQERRRLFRRIAREFPGALRELDSFCAARLEARADRIEAELSRATERDLAPGEWAAVVLDFHRTLREALAVKRWVARRLPRGGAVPVAVVVAFTKRLERLHRLRHGGSPIIAGGKPSFPHEPGGEGEPGIKRSPISSSPPQDPLLPGIAASGDTREDATAALLARHLRPPGGRLLSLVWATLEERHGRPREELEGMVFGGT